MNEQEKALKTAKATCYAQGNRASKLLASMLRTRQPKSWPPFVVDPVRNSQVSHPTDIANAFQKYYSTLYKLKDYPTTAQPTDAAISAFLDTYNFP